MKDNACMNIPVIESKKTRKKYDQAFKRQAVELWLRSGKTATEVAKELGIHDQRLWAWKKRFAPPPTGGEGGGGVCFKLMGNRKSQGHGLHLANAMESNLCEERTNHHD